MNQPVNTPSMTPKVILAQFTTLVVVSIFSPFFAITASRDPTKIAMNSFGVAAAVARANINGFTVGKVEMAPFEMLYGSGHRRIMNSSFRPSCFSTSDRASNRLSFATSRCTKFDSRVRETTNEQTDPATVAEATIGQLKTISWLCRVAQCRRSDKRWRLTPVESHKQIQPRSGMLSNL